MVRNKLCPSPRSLTGEYEAYFQQQFLNHFWIISTCIPFRRKCAPLGFVPTVQKDTQPQTDVWTLAPIPRGPSKPILIRESISNKLQLNYARRGKTNDFQITNISSMVSNLNQWSGSRRRKKNTTGCLLLHTKSLLHNLFLLT